MIQYTTDFSETNSDTKREQLTTHATCWLESVGVCAGRLVKQLGLTLLIFYDCKVESESNDTKKYKLVAPLL